MVKSLRYDQKNCDDSCAVVVAGRVQCAGHTDADTDSFGHAASDCNPTPHGHANSDTNLPAGKSGGRVGAARSV